MLSSGSDFPREELMNCLRNHGKGKEEFVKEAKNLNIQWIYEIIKYCCNVLFEIKEIPDTKFAALTLVKDLFETCQVPCVHLIEVYVLPIIYEFAIYKPQEKAEKRGNFFFQNNGFSARLPNIEETGMKFIALCSEMVYFGSLIKKHRTFQDQELKQQSQFMEFYQKFKKYGIDGSAKSPKDLKYFSEKTAKTASQQYLKNLKQFESHCEDYSQYFVFKMVESLQSQQNVLFSSAGKTISSLSNDLDMRKILKYGDTYITSPLLQQLTEELKNAQNFLIKRNFLSLLSDFVKWADIESFIQICYDDALDTVAPRIAEVNGDKGLNEGQLIYPEIKGQRESKKKFYIEFLKSLQIWSKCIKGDLEDQEEPSKVEQFYEYFKIQRKFIFPENLMSKRIEIDFAKCQQFNSERNEKILEKLRNDKTSIVHGKKSTSINKAELAKSSQLAKQKLKPIPFQEINQRFEDCFQDFITLADDEDQISHKMKKLRAFKEQFENDLENVEEDGRPFEQFQDLLDNGDELIENIEAAEELYNNYTKKKITFKQFQQEFELILEQMQDPEEEEEEGSNVNSSSNNNDTSLSISQSKKSIKNKLSKNMGSNSALPEQPPLIESPHLIKQPSISQINPKISNLSKKLKSKRQSQIKKSQIKSSIKPKKSSILASNLPNQPSLAQQAQSGSAHPYYEGEGPRISKLSKLQNKSIHSKTSKLSDKLKSRRSELSQQPSYKKSEREPSNLEFGSDYMMVPKQSEKKSFKEMIQSHRSSRLSDKSSRIRSNYQRQSKGQPLDTDSNIVHYEKRDEVAVVNFNQHSQILTEQVNEGYGAVPIKNSIRRDKIQSKNEQIKGESKIVSNFSRKSLLKDKNEKASSIMRSRRSSNSRLSATSSQKYGNIRENKGHALKNDNANDYMMQPSKIQEKPKSHRFSQLSSKRPASSHSKYKEETHKSKGSKYQKQSQMRPQTSSNQQLLRNQEIHDHYQIRRNINEEDKIKDLDLKPMENSYYGIEEIEAKVKNSSKMQFKQCFQIQKEVIQVGGRRTPLINDPGLRKGKSTNQSSSFEEMNVNKNPQEEYLMMKLRREHDQEQNDELKRMQGRILKLKTETSKIRRDLSSRSQDNREFSLSRRSRSGASSRDFCSFSSSKNSRNSSFHSISKERVNTSRVDSIAVEGRLLNVKDYDRHYAQIKDENVKKTFLRSKAILLKNQYLELGSVFRRQNHNLKIMMYLTPNVDISNLNISVAKQFNMDIGIFPEVFSEIPRGKQVRITLDVELKSAPYNMPTMFVNFLKGGREEKSFTVTLPCSLHRFVEFHPVNDRQQFISKFENVGENIVKTAEFRVSRRVGKLEHIQEYFPKLTTVLINGDTHKYGAQCVFKRERFLLMLTTRKPQIMTIQGISLTRPELVEYLLSFLRHIFTMDQ